MANQGAVWLTYALARNLRNADRLSAEVWNAHREELLRQLRALAPDRFDRERLSYWTWDLVCETIGHNLAAAAARFPDAAKEAFCRYLDNIDANLAAAGREGERYLIAEVERDDRVRFFEGFLSVYLGDSMGENAVQNEAPPSDSFLYRLGALAEQAPTADPIQWGFAVVDLLIDLRGADPSRYDTEVRRAA